MPSYLKLFILIQVLIICYQVVLKLVTSADRTHNLQSKCEHLFIQKAGPDGMIGVCRLCGAEKNVVQDKKCGWCIHNNQMGFPGCCLDSSGSWISRADVQRFVADIELAIHGPGRKMPLDSLGAVAVNIEYLFGPENHRLEYEPEEAHDDVIEYDFIKVPRKNL